MILYTYQDLNMVFPTDESAFQQSQMLDIPGGQLMVEQEGKDYRIVRLLSTDPNLYLNPKYGPGELYRPEK